MNYTQVYVNNYFGDSGPTYIKAQRKKKKKKKKNLALSTVGFCPPLNKVLKNNNLFFYLWTLSGQRTHFGM